MMRYYGIFLICALVIGCTALLTEQTYVRIDAPVTITKTPHGVVYAFPEKKLIRKIRIVGEGTLQNVRLGVRDDASNWVRVKTMKQRFALPIEIPITWALPTDAVRIQRTKAAIPTKKGWASRGQINTVEFYTTVSGGQ